VWLSRTHISIFRDLGVALIVQERSKAYFVEEAKGDFSTSPPSFPKTHFTSGLVIQGSKLSISRRINPSIAHCSQPAVLLTWD
jgi:hypothetical protein